MNKQMLKTFENPGSEFRGAPFWAWNGKLEPEELRRQIRIMNEMGLGGFFMHARVGMNTPYLEKEWFDCVDTCLEEAEKLDMQAWLYDEDRWPSGAAGGLVTKNPEYRQRQLCMLKTTKPSEAKWDEPVLAIFIGTIKGASITDVEQVTHGKEPRSLKKGESYLLFFMHINEPSSWFNGYTYLDTMNPDAVKEFISVTHERYRKHCGNQFGKRIPGIFTDEPHNSHKVQECTVNNKKLVSTSWTDRLPEVFIKRYGYDLISRLPELFYDVDGQQVSQVRYHYNDCTTHLFVTSFTKQIGDWCEKNNIQFTGHLLWEDVLVTQTNMVGSCMRSYEYMQAPGMDLLTEHWRIFNTAKQVSSAAHQFGRKWRITETYGCTGWQFSFEGHKALGDWQTALGINLRCQHLAWYTMEGEAKRDYPASIFYQSPWWKQYRMVEDYFARINAIMTQGEEVRDALVLHPVESMWTKTRIGWHSDKSNAKIEQAFQQVTDKLLAENIDYDFADEDILARHGSVEGSGDKLRLRIGKAVYKSVVVPELQTIRATTLALLKKYRAAGGQIVFVDNAPKYIEALRSDDAATFADTCEKVTFKTLAESIAPQSRRVSIQDENGKELEPVLYLLREDADSYYMFIVNTGENYSTKTASGFSQAPVETRTIAFEKVRVKLFEKTTGTPAELCPHTGKILQTNAKQTKTGEWDIATSLPKLGSRLFVFPKKAEKLDTGNYRQTKTVSTKTLSGDWNYVLSENNALLLDACNYKIGNSALKYDYIIHVDHAIRDALKIQHRGGSMVQPWARPVKTNPVSIPVELKYHFNVKALPSGSLRLAIEQPETFNIKLNGNPLETNSVCGWWVDLSLKTIEFSPSLLKMGKNELILTIDYPETHPGLEYIYLLGNFGTKLTKDEMTITTTATKLKTGDWGKQGLTFYGGNVAYIKTITPKFKKGERVILQIGDYKAAGARVLIDGQEVGIVGWAPNTVDITDAITNGKTCLLAIEILGSRRNSHGPFHQKEMKPLWTGPDTYQQYVAKGYKLMTHGLMSSPKLITLKC